MFVGDYDPALATRDSISVGTPLSRLADLPGIRVDAHCGKSFEVDGLPRGTQDWSPAQLRELSDSAQVVRILVVGRCDGHP